MNITVYALPHLAEQGLTINNTTPRSFRPLTPQRIIETICTEKGIRFETLHSKSRKGETPYCRQLIMYVLKKRLDKDLSLKAIGQLFGDRDHSTVIHSIQAIKDWISWNETKRREVTYFLEYDY